VIGTLKMDKAGRVVLPKPVRDKLRLKPGDALEAGSSNESIVLRPVRRHGRIYKKQGFWVLNSGEPLEVDVVNRTLRQVRKECDRRNLGNLPCHSWAGE
jgi:AbrB family looped-hinge helix DNA binding protein